MSSKKELSRSQMRKLTAFKNALGDQRVAEEIRPIGAPFITESTLNQLIVDYNLLGFSQFKEPTIDLEKREKIHPFLLAREITAETFITLQEIPGPFVPQTHNWLMQNMGMSRGYGDSREVPAPIIDAGTIGISYIIYAYRLQLGYPFLAALQRLTSQELSVAFQDSTQSLNMRLTIIDRASSKRHIPDNQVFLNRGLLMLKDSSPIEEPLQDGANAMYHVVDKLWPKISPNLR